jgi:hypothetical protein
MHLDNSRSHSPKIDVLSTSEQDFPRGRENNPRPLGNCLADGYAFTQAAGVFCKGRRFAVTRKGYLAIVPPLTKPGDMASLIMGAEVSFILRRLPLQRSNGGSRKRQCYNLVGECYIHGVMDEEILKRGRRNEILKCMDDFLLL